MVKKFIQLGALAAFVLAGAVSAQAAGVDTTSHEQQKSGGACAACHLPHGAQGKRLWVAAPVANAKVKGDVAMLCSYCHLRGGGATGLRGADPISDSFVYGDSSHGVLMTTTNLPRNTVWSELPYHVTGGTKPGVIQCTTCHDVHNNDVGKTPFLRVSINLLCASCHGDRQRSGAAWQEGNLATATFGAWGRAANLGVLNPGSHPVGTDITGDGNSGAPITIWRSMKIGFATSRDRWVTGGHLSGGDTGGVTCATCHAVHGVRHDDDDTGSGFATNEFPADRTQPTGNMLAIYQNTWMEVSGRTVANGNGGYNGLCEGCHVGNNTQMLTAYNITSTGVTFAVASGPRNPNPGATAYGHPVDGMRVTAGRNWVPNGAAWPIAGLNWPIGNSVAASASNPNVICESCHVTHAAANATRNDLNVAPGRALTTDYMLRSTFDDICWACHTQSLSSHHPVGKVYNTAGVTYLAAISGAARNSTLDCATCHGGTGAHNWNGKGQVGLDPNWLPTDNGRGTRAVETFNRTASITCMDCHTGMRGTPKGNRSPTLHAALDSTYSGPNYQTVAEAYNTIGYGSHALGRMGGVTNPIRSTKTVAAYWPSLGARLGNLFDPAGATNLWTAATYGGAGYWSRFGGTSAEPVLVCESCHELQPGRNASTHLLLGYSVEETPAISASQDRSYFCEGCHNPTGTHQMTGQTVTRTGVVLSTNTAASWLVTPTDTVNVKLSANNRMNCDTCHQVHDANSASQTFILDVNRVSVMMTGSVAVANAGVWGSYSGYWPTIQLNKGGNHNKFCQQCHQY